MLPQPGAATEPGEDTTARVREAEHGDISGEEIEALNGIRPGLQPLGCVGEPGDGARRGRVWTHFEARARRHGETAFADRLVTAAHAEPQHAHDVPEWLADRIALSYEARLLVGDDVTPEQNARDNLLAYAGLYRGRFPTAANPWMGPPPNADPRAAISAVRALVG